MKYLIWWKEFTVEHNSWKREKDLKNVKEVIDKFEERMNT